MKLVEFFIKLNEAPLGRFDPSAVSEPQYHPTDVKMMNSPTYHERLSKALSKSPMTINILTAVFPEVDHRSGGTPMVSLYDDDIYGKIDKHFKAEMAERGIKLPRMGNMKTGINLLIVTNVVGGGDLPLTPWIVAHRLAHAVVGDKPAWKYRSYIDDTLDDAYEEVTGEMVDVNDSPEKFIPWLTMRSARSGKMRGAEVAIELLTQYLISGRITLTPEAPDGLEEELNRLAGEAWANSSGSYWTT